MRVVPVGPDLRPLATLHGRAAQGGRPFGDGTAPGPLTAGEAAGTLPDGMARPVLTSTPAELA